jgi:serine/threonine protein kinase
MPDDNKTTQWDESPDNRPLDPLGVIGWVIGGKYKVRSYLGGGGFGEVYDGYNVNLVEQKLVIKFFKKVQAREKFDKEAKILCLLDHPNISRVIDYLPEEGALIVAFIDGKDGKEILKESGPLSGEMLLKVARTMTGALAYAHEKKIAHRDIKPDNILIDQNDHVYLIDFGIAKVMREDATKTAYQALTPMFAAPERQSGDANYNPFLSDIYETGVTIFNFATNEMPYRNPANPDISEWGGPKAKNLSPQMRHILKKATHPDPSCRYKTIAEMNRDFKMVQQVYGGKSHKSLWTTAALLIILAGAAYLTKDRWLPLVQPPPQIAETVGKIPETGGSKTPDKPDSNLTAGQSAQIAAKIPSAEEKPASSQSTSTPVKEQKTDDVSSETAAAESIPEVKTEPEVIAAKEPEPEKPKSPTLLVNVIPEYNITILVDGAEKSPNKKFDIDSGNHVITIIHPDFPILSDQIQTNVDKTVRYNLQDEFFLADTVTFRIGATPTELGDAILEVLFNGYGKKYSAENLPILDLQKKSGKWDLRFNILNSQGQRYSGANVDSVITFPYGGGPREIIRRGMSTIDFGESKWKSSESVDMLVYWSKK